MANEIATLVNEVMDVKMTEFIYKQRRPGGLLATGR
jgi:hypothetical protein